MDDIPTELLCLIFTACLPNPPTAPDRNSFPLNLTHVCSRWRRLVCQIPDMWTCIRIEAFQKFHSCTRRRILDVREEQLKIWFANAKDHPLTLYLDLALVEPLQGKMSDGSWSHFLRFALIERVQSLRALQLVFTNPRCYEDFFKLPPSHFHILEEIRLHSARDSGHGIYQGNEDFTLFSRTPRLTRLMLNRRQYSTLNYKIPYQQLTHLTMQCSESLHHVLGNAAGLQRLCLFLENGAVHHATQVPSQVLTMKYLQRLTIHSYRSIDQLIFAGIHFPSLTHFHLFVNTCRSNVKFNWSPLQQNHDHFIDQLKHLRVLSILNPNDISKSQLIEVLQSVRQLETLILDVKCFAHPRLLYSLNDSEDGILTLMPHLKELHVFLERNEPFLGEDSQNMTMRSIARMILTRSTSGQPEPSLKKVVFWTQGPGERHMGYHRWREDEAILRTYLDNIPGLGSSVISLRNRSDWLAWWAETAAIEEECF